MRLLVRLRSIENGRYEMQYHYHLQSYIYNLLKGGKYDYIHDKNSFKFFCYSNIFPAKDLARNDLRTLIISSPDKEFIGYLSKIFDEEANKSIQVGRMQFNVENTQALDIRIPDYDGYTLITGTPIMLRINKKHYTKYGIKPRFDYDYVYWRTEYPIELFLIQLERNLRKKFRDFHNHSLSKNIINNGDEHFDAGEKELPLLFQRASFKKQVSTKIIMKGTHQTVIGTLWEFIFEGWEDKEILQFALDAGLGERNSLGFGFMNLVKNKDSGND